MPCFSLLKGLETQPWLDLCNLFISFQAGLCKLFHEGRAKEAGEGSKHTYRKQTTLGSSLFGRVGSWGKTEMGGRSCGGLSGGDPAGEGDWGFHCCFSHTLQKPCPGFGSWSPRLGKLLSLHSAGSLGKEVIGVRRPEWQQAKRELAAWSHFPGICFRPLPRPHHHRQGMQGSPGPRESTKSAEPTSSVQLRNQKGPSIWLQWEICM